ncbi:MAG TPA: universal stress protein [Polyangiaceae bacterium]|nr:universal stress protein [Polyangiaceae bacterium]
MRVLVATDLSAAADIALRQGSALIHSPSDAFAVVHVLPVEYVDFIYTDPQVLSDRTAERVKDATSVVHERTATLTARPDAIFVDEGTDYAAVIRRAEAWNADVIVVGSSGRSGLDRSVGHVATKVVRHAHCSVLVARPSPESGWVLAATDLSEPSLPAISAAAVEARRRGAKLKVVHAVSFGIEEAAYLLQLSTPSMPNEISELRPIRAALVEAVAKISPGATSELLSGPVVAEIVREAESLSAELLVVATRGRTGLARLALGSVAEKLVRTAPCSVLAVRKE